LDGFRPAGRSCHDRIERAGFDHSTFSLNRARLVEHGVAVEFLGR
jgi:hypothetical protein